MKVRYHLLFSLLLIFFLYRAGFGPLAIFTALFFSILPDIDHLLLGRDIGTFYPPTVYRYYKDLRAKGINDPPAHRIIGFRYPLHNIFVAVAALFIYLPAGAGLLFHQLLDFIDLMLPGTRGEGAF
jgi:hypothetical protein